MVSDTIDAKLAISGGSRSAAISIWLERSSLGGHGGVSRHDHRRRPGCSHGKAAGDDASTRRNKITDDGQQLDDAAVVGGSSDQCGLSTANDSLLGAILQPAALAANGGPTQTMALVGPVPRRSAGGERLYPTNARCERAIRSTGR